jgi:hypothetical protein
MLELCIVLYNFAYLDVIEAILMIFFLLFLKYLRVCDTLCFHPYAFTLCSNGSAHTYGIRRPKFILASCAKLYSVAETPLPPPPHLG